MSTENKKLCVDRIEDGVAVAYSDDGTEYTMCHKIADIHESDIITASINDRGEVVAVEVRKEETAERKVGLHERLKKLFDK